MLFNSTQFLIFFPIVVLLYFAIPDRWKRLFLLAASYFYYMCWNAKYALLLLFSTVVTYLCGLLIDQTRQKRWKEGKIRRYCRFFLALSFALNLGILFYYKYINFAIETLTNLLRYAHIELNIPAYDILLPVGISFFTFQALGYTMDVYRGDIYAERNFFQYALFVSFFPQLVAGPIERSKNLLKQLSVNRRFNYERAKEGLLLMLWGFYLKIVVADRIAIFVDTVYADHEAFPGWYLIVATLIFNFQSYCDFAGYTTIAMGAAKILGFSLIENFNAPYFARSIKEFWSRWHLSLTTWFRDYLYFPLGGSRKGKPRKYRNIMIVFLVSGLWHGANITYVIWGGLNGLYQVLGEIFQPVKDRVVSFLHLHRETIGHQIVQMMFTFTILSFSIIFFRAPDLPDALAVIHSIRTASNPGVLLDGALFQCGLDQANFHLMMGSIVVIMIADYCKLKGIRIREVILRQDYWFQWLIFLFAFLFVLIFGLWGPEFVSQNFMYYQF